VAGPVPEGIYEPTTCDLSAVLGTGTMGPRWRATCLHAGFGVECGTSPWGQCWRPLSPTGPSFAVDPAEAATGADVLITMRPMDPPTERSRRLYGPGPTAAVDASFGAIWISDARSGRMDATLADLATATAHLVDAPVSVSSEPAARGETRNPRRRRGPGAAARESDLRRARTISLFSSSAVVVLR